MELLSDREGSSRAISELPLQPSLLPHNNNDMAIPSDELHGDQQGAFIHNVASRRVVSIEHPAIVKNFERGLKSLGGEAQIKHVSERFSDANSISCSGRFLNITWAIRSSAASKMDCQNLWLAYHYGPMTL